MIKQAFLSTLFAGVVASAVSLTPSTANAQEVYVGGVPDVYIATTQPVYYGGRAHYWYNGHWAYRDGGAWRYYRAEPTYFHDWRYRYPNGGWGHWRR